VSSRRLLLGLLLVFPAGSAGPLACTRAPAAASELRSVAVPADTALHLRRRVEGFYLRLAGRRFNTLETYSDRIMREHFRSPNLFLDYYADLAQAFADAHLERRRPLRVDVLELRFQDARQARVEIRFVGEDDRPLRPFQVTLLRVDRWEWSDGTWWVQPGKI
jgi:hypothetical protein